MPDADALNMAEFDDVPRVLEERGYENTGELEGPGTFAVKGGVIDVFPGNMPYPGAARLLRRRARRDSPHRALDRADHFRARRGGDLRRARVLSTPPWSRARRCLEAPGAHEPALRELLEQLEGGLHFDGADALLPYLYDTTVTLGDYAARYVLTCLIEPRSLFDDAMHASEEIDARRMAATSPWKACSPSRRP